MTRFFIAMLLATVAVVQAQTWPHRSSETLSDRIAVPVGYKRLTSEPKSFESWLRALPLKPTGSKILLFNGKRWKKQSRHVAVVDLDVDPVDLQQCADAIMRLRAEFLRDAHRENEIEFLTAGGKPLNWPVWKKESGSDGNYGDFREYLKKVFGLANTYSLDKQMVPVPNAKEILPGDAFVKGGFPGHAVLVLDVAENKKGERIFLLGQSLTPAQDFHIIKNRFSVLSPWYKATGEGELLTPEWVFEWNQLRRFAQP